MSRRCELCGAGSSDERLGDGTGGSPPPGERGRSVPRRGELCGDGASVERSGDAAGELSGGRASDERRGDAAGEATRDSAGRCGEGSASVGGCDEGAPRAAAAGPLLPRPKNANIALRSLCAALCQVRAQRCQVPRPLATFNLGGMTGMGRARGGALFAALS